MHPLSRDLFRPLIDSRVGVVPRSICNQKCERGVPSSARVMVKTRALTCPVNHVSTTSRVDPVDLMEHRWQKSRQQRERGSGEREMHRPGVSLVVLEKLSVMTKGGWGTKQSGHPNPTGHSRNPITSLIPCGGPPVG